MPGPFSNQGKEHPAFQNQPPNPNVGVEAQFVGPPPLPHQRNAPKPLSLQGKAIPGPASASGRVSPLGIAAYVEVAAFEREEAGLDASTARRLEDAFLAGFRHNVRGIQALGSEIDGNVYDFNADREHLRVWDERAEAARFVSRGGASFKVSHFPQSPTHQFTIVRKPLFGTPSAKISLSASVWSPMAALSAGAIPYGQERAGVDALEIVLKQLLVAERQEIFHYVAICSTTGWDEGLFLMPPDGVNYGVALIEPRFPGWAVAAPEHWTLAVKRSFQPESEGDMRDRVAAAIASHPDLEETGGIVLLAEISELTGVAEEIVEEEAEVFCTHSKRFSFDFVEGSTIIRRLRD